MASRVILLVGCAGSGKSTYARQQFPGAPIVTADQFFERLAKRFKRTYGQVFDVRKLRDAHSQCEQEFMAAIVRETPIMVVDNTNVQAADRQRYLKMATELGCTTELHVLSPWMHGSPAPSPEEIVNYVRHCHERNIHGVPLGVVTQQFVNLDLPSGIYLTGKPPQFLGPLPIAIEHKI